MEIKLETVTPKRAKQYLNRNKNNRHLRDGIVERYAQDMLDGRWTECTVPISFYENNDVADGQHRLWAIIESGKSQKFLVARGLSREAGLNIDTGLSRSLVDAGKISGLDNSLSHSMIAVCRSFKYGDRGIQNSRRGASNAEKLDWVNAYREPCSWAVHNGPTGKLIRNSITLTAIARAYTAEKDAERLARFSEVLTKGFSQDESESAAVAIRNYLLTKGTLASSATVWRDTFMKVQNAIWYFMRKKPLYVIKSQSEERYPRKG